MLPTSVPSPVLIELNDANNTVQRFFGDRNPDGTGIFWATPNNNNGSNNNNNNNNSNNNNTTASLPLHRQKTSATVDIPAHENKNDKSRSGNKSNDESNNANKTNIDNNSRDKSSKGRLLRRRLSSVVSSRDSESDRKRQVDHHLTPPTLLDFNESNYRLPPGRYRIL